MEDDDDDFGDFEQPKVLLDLIKETREKIGDCDLLKVCEGSKKDSPHSSSLHELMDQDSLWTDLQAAPTVNNCAWMKGQACESLLTSLKIDPANNVFIATRPDVLTPTVIRETAAANSDKESKNKDQNCRNEIIQALNKLPTLEFMLCTSLIKE